MTRDSSANGGIQWSEHPGRFERHLQRRLGNPLFPLSRQVVSMEEVSKAVEQDEYEQGKFWAWFNNFSKNFKKSASPSMNLDEILNFLKDLNFWMSYAAAIEGLAGHRVDQLHKMHDEILDKLDNAVPEGKELNRSLRAQTFVSIIPILAGIKMTENPIQKGEEAAAVLCEDLNTISLIGEASREFGKGFHPSESELLALIEKGLKIEWFTTEKAKEMTSALTGKHK